MGIGRRLQQNKVAIISIWLCLARSFLLLKVNLWKGFCHYGNVVQITVLILYYTEEGNDALLN